MEVKESFKLTKQINVKLYHMDHSVMFKMILNVHASKYVGK